MTWDYVSATGFTAELSTKAVKKIKTRFAAFPIAILDQIFEQYLILRGPLEGKTGKVNLKAHPTAVEIKTEIASFQKAVLDLDALVSSLTPAARHLINESSVLQGRSAMLGPLSASLGDAAMIAFQAGTRVPAGRRRHPHAALVDYLAPIIAEAGLEVNAKPNGALVTITDILLREAEENPTDTRKIVAEAMRGWKLHPPAPGQVSTKT